MVLLGRAGTDNSTIAPLQTHALGITTKGIEMARAESRAVKLYVMEEQEIYRELYKATLSSKDPVQLLEVTSNGDISRIGQAVSEFSPDVLLLGIKKLERNLIEELGQIRTVNSKLGIVLLLVYYDEESIKLLRKLALRDTGGMALFLKQSLDQVEQLCGIIQAVSHGQVILDPPLATYMFAGRPECPFLKQLTAIELEILSLLSQGYTNAAIAQTLFIDVKTVEHHLNSMYSKLKTDPDYSDKHLRVSAARLYLETMGEPYPKEDMLASAHRV